MVELIDIGLKQPKDEAEWLAWRQRGIGASEASAIVGKNPYMSNQELYRRKIGAEQPEDISGKACVIYGHAAEAPIRELFALDHPEYTVQYGGAFDMVRHPKYPWLFATLDGRLIEKETGKRGIYEGKTTEILRSMQMEKWVYTDEQGHKQGRVPDNYYVQLLHQLLATGWDFAVLTAGSDAPMPTAPGLKPAAIALTARTWKTICNTFCRKRLSFGGACRTASLPR